MPDSSASARADFLAQLGQALPADALLRDPTECWAYSYDNSRRHLAPMAVVLAESTDMVCAVARLCHAHRVPLTVRGRGTGTAGGSVPAPGGIVLSLERLRRVLRRDPANRLLVVEAGATNTEVQQAAAADGFFWAPDPTSAAYCTVGGNVAVNAAGPRAIKYGTTRDNVLGLRAVLADGREVRCGGYTTKMAVGYDLTRLLIGSEGTLAIVTEATLKLLPLPETRRLLQLAYADAHAATAAITRIMAQPVTPCALEFMDRRAIEMIRDYTEAPLPQGAGALLMLEVDGASATIDTAVAAVRAAAHGHGLIEAHSAENEAENRKLWSMRKALSPALRSIAPNKLNEDVVVPVARLPELIDGLERLSAQYGIPIVNFGHAGNGNIHVNLLYDAQDPAQSERARPCLDAVFALVLALDGTISGEHGIGLAKRDFMERALSPDTLDLMRRLKDMMDPLGILNPGKVLPP